MTADVPLGLQIAHQRHLLVGDHVQHPQGLRLARVLADSRRPHGLLAEVDLPRFGGEPAAVHLDIFYLTVCSKVYGEALLEADRLLEGLVSRLRGQTLPQLGQPLLEALESSLQILRLGLRTPGRLLVSVGLVGPVGL